MNRDRDTVSRAVVALCAAGLLLGAGTAHAADQPALPKVAKYPRTELFPPSEIRLNRMGTVVVRFSIDESGKPRSLRVVDSASNAFDASAKGFVKALRFSPTDDWRSAGGSKVHYRFAVLFRFKPCAELPRLDGVDSQIQVCRGQLPGSGTPQNLD